MLSWVFRRRLNSYFVDGFGKTGYTKDNLMGGDMRIRWNRILLKEKILFVFVLFWCVGCNSSPTSVDPVRKTNSSEPVIPTATKKIANTQQPKVATPAPGNGSSGSLFDPNIANSTVPADIQGILEEIAYYGMGGGDGDENPCEGINNPTIVSEWTEIEQMQYAWVSMCGWESNADVAATLHGPNDYFYQEVLRSGKYGPLYWSHFLDIDAPLGEYRVEFSSGKKYIGLKFNLSRATEPGVLMFYIDKNIQVFAFRPNEKLRVFKYDYDYGDNSFRMKAWSEFKTDTRGYLRIDLTDQSKDYIVLGETSGEFPLNSVFRESILKANSTQGTMGKVLCGGAPKSFVSVGAVARITFTDGTPTRIRAKPTASAKILGRLAEGTQFKVVNGPKCADNYTWWQIQLANGTRGWVAEGSKSSYFIEPVTEKQSTCTSMKIRLSAGKQARVVRVDGSNMRLREKPGFGENILGRISEGSLLKILDGPRCVDGNNWWYVQTPNGDKGWMTESQNGVYLLEPYP